MSAILAIGALYELGHLIVYLVFVRRQPAFRRERVIFLYHAASFLAVAAVLAFVLALTGGAAALLPAAAIVLAVHGMYSLTFLELWSLSEGGYSLAILRRAADGPEAVELASLLGLAAVGIQKRTVRLQHLADLGLVDQLGPAWRLTARGRLATSAIKAVSWLAGVRRRG